MALELFTDYGTASKQNVTIRESGLVYISNSLLRDCFDLTVSEAGSYQIFVDREDKSVAIAVLPGFDEDSGSKQFSSTQKTKSGVLVNAMPVLRSLGFRDKGFHKADLDVLKVEHNGYNLLKFSAGDINPK